MKVKVENSLSKRENNSECIYVTDLSNKWNDSLVLIIRVGHI